MKRFLLLLVVLTVLVVIFAANSPVYSCCTGDDHPQGPGYGAQTDITSIRRMDLPCLGGFGQFGVAYRGAIVFLLNGAPDDGIPLLGPKYDVDITFVPEEPSLPSYQAQVKLKNQGFFLSTRAEEVRDGTKYYFDLIDSVELTGSDGSLVTINGPLYAHHVTVVDGNIFVKRHGSIFGATPITCQ